MTCAGCNLVETAPKTLADGRVVCTNCEDWRHECESRMVLSRPTTQDRRDYLAAVEVKRGKPAADRLRETILQLWELRKG